MPAPSKELVLVTGVSGFIGAHVVEHLLQAGYAVRGTSRSAKAEELRQRYNTPNFEVTVVDDLIKGDMSDALKGVSSVIHLASPLPTEGLDVVGIAVEGTMNMIRQAYAARVYKLVVVSSILAAVKNFPGDMHDSSLTLTAEDWNSMTAEEARKPDTLRHVSYAASKALAERAAWEFAENHPQLDLTTLLPPFVYGPLAPGHIISPTSPRDSLSSNRYIFDLIAGPKAVYPQYGSPQCVDVRDVARAATLALTSSPAPSGKRKRIHLLGGLFHWNEAVRHIATVRPDLKERLLDRGVPAHEESSGAMGTDIEQARKYLGLSEFIGWRKSIEDAVDSIIEREAAWVR